ADGDRRRVAAGPAGAARRGERPVGGLEVDGQGALVADRQHVEPGVAVDVGEGDGGGPVRDGGAELDRDGGRVDREGAVAVVSDHYQRVVPRGVDDVEQVAEPHLVDDFGAPRAADGDVAQDGRDGGGPVLEVAGPVAGQDDRPLIRRHDDVEP